jgi:hypothetical protein
MKALHKFDFFIQIMSIIRVQLKNNDISFFLFLDFILSVLTKFFVCFCTENVPKGNSEFNRKHSKVFLIYLPN